MSHFRALALDSASDITNVLTTRESEDVWSSPPEQGKSLELATFALLYGALKGLGAEPEIPKTLVENTALWNLRNELPRSHSAQAGHSSLSLSPDQRFVAALTPKLSFRFRERAFAVFREGYPLHALASYIAHRNTYRERPDFVVVEGRFEVEATSSTTRIHAVLPEGSITSEIRNLDGPVPHLISWNNQLTNSPMASALLECSWNKSVASAEEQLIRYRKLMGPLNANHTTFVTARNGQSTQIPIIFVPPLESSAAILRLQFRKFLEVALGLAEDRFK